MAYLVLVVDLPKDSIQTLNDNCQFATKTFESVRGAVNILEAIEAGAKPGIVQITTRDTDPSVATHGSGSQQNSYDLS